jgi:hypothetical protein
MATLTTCNGTAAASGTCDQPGIETAGSDAVLSHLAASKDAQTPAKLPRTMPAVTEYYQETDETHETRSIGLQ